MVNFLVVGCCIRSFGIFFELLQERYRTSAVEIAWIPAIVGSVGLFSGTINNNNNELLWRLRPQEPELRRATKQNH